MDKRRAGIVAGLAVLLGTTMVGPALAESPARPRPPRLLASVPGTDAKARPAPVDSTPAVQAVPPVRWPAAGSVEIALSGSATGLTRAPGGLPVRVGAGSRAAAGAPVSKVRVELIDRAIAQRSGYDLLVRLARTDGASVPGSVAVGLDYSSFRDAYGADWFRRLRLVSVPACALTTPDRPACTARSLAATNDTVGRVLSAEVPVGPAQAQTSGTTGIRHDDVG